MKSKDKNLTAKAPKQMRHYYSQDVTIEALIPIFNASPKGIVIYRDELSGLVKGFNQYKRKGSDTEQFLSLFNAGPLKSDRKQGSSSCPTSGAAVIGGIQTAVFAEVFNEAEHENGLAYRFLPLLLNDVPRMYSDDDLSEEHQMAWHSMVKRTTEIAVDIDLDAGGIVKNELVLDEDGIEAWKEFHDELSKLEPFMPLRFSRYLPKLKTYCLKFMAMLHLLKCYKNHEHGYTVDKSTVKGAIELARFFAGQALKLTLSTSTKERQGEVAYGHVFMKALASLKDDVKNGKLLLKQVRVRVNELLPQDLALGEKDKNLGAWLRKQGFEVQAGAKNKTFVLWDESLVTGGEVS